MDAVLVVLQNYSKMIAGGAAVLAVLVLFLLLTRILKHIKRLNKNLSSITENVQAYFDVIFSDDGEEAISEEVRQQSAEQKRSVEERSIKSAEQQKKEEEEKIVNAVLQEYFT